MLDVTLDVTRSYLGPQTESTEFNANKIKSSTDGYCALWLRSDNLTLSQSFVQTWLDKSTAFPVNFSSPNPENRPVFIATGSNGTKGQPEISFNGINQFLESVGSVQGLNGASGLTVFAFMAPLNVSQSLQYFLDSAQNRNTSSSFAAAIGTIASGSSALQLSVTNKGGTETIASASLVSQLPYNTRTSGAYYTLLFRRNGTADAALTASVNGSTLGAFRYFSSGPNTGSFESNLLTIGSKGTDINFFSGTISEIIIYNHILSASHISEVETYLSGRYFSSSYADTLNPADVTSSGTGRCVFWIRSDDVTVVNGKVTSINERAVGNNWDLSQSNSSKQATYIPASSFNGMPMLMFSASEYSTAQTMPHLTGTNQLHVFAVFTPGPDNPDGTSKIIYEYTEDTNTNQGFLLSNESAAAQFSSRVDIIQAGIGRTGAGFINNSVASYARLLNPSVDNDLLLINKVINKTSATASEQLMLSGNGHSLNKEIQDSSVGNTTNFDNGRMHIGHRANTTTNYFSGGLLEIIMYDHILSASEVSNVENYLKNRYALTYSLDPRTVSSSVSGRCAMWINAAEVALTGATAGQLKELALENHLTQSAGRQALWLSRSEGNGRPGLYYPNTGNTGSYATRATHTAFTGKQDITIFAVVQPASASIVGGTFFDIYEHSVNFNTNTGFCLGIGTGGTSTPKVVFFGHGNGGGATWATGSFENEIPPNTAMSCAILTAKVINKSSPITSLNVSGNNQPITLKQGDNGSSTTGYGTHKTFLGNRNSTFYFSGVIHEVIAYDHALNQAQEQQIFTYLSGKYLTIAPQGVFDPLSIRNTAGSGALMWVRFDNAQLDNDGRKVSRILGRAGSNINFSASTAVSQSYSLVGAKKSSALKCDTLSASYGALTRLNLTSSNIITVFSAINIEGIENGGSQQVVFDTTPGLFSGGRGGASISITRRGTTPQAFIETTRYDGTTLASRRTSGSIASVVGNMSGCILITKFNSSNTIGQATQLSGVNSAGVVVPLSLDYGLSTGVLTSGAFGSHFPSICGRFDPNGNNSGGNDFFTGSVHEIIVYNYDVSGRDMQRIATYLSSRYL